MNRNDNCGNKFCLPKANFIGIVGPTGPTGPAGTSEISAYGRKYDTTQNTITLEANISQNVPLGSTGPTKDVTTDTQNALTITQDGTYLINYYFSGSANTATSLTIEVNQNSTPIGSTTITKDLTANVDEDFSGNTINTFTNGDNIYLAIESTNAATISPASGTSAYLNITRLS